jgi:hypothetical protein
MAISRLARQSDKKNPEPIRGHITRLLDWRAYRMGNKKLLLLILLFINEQ